MEKKPYRVLEINGQEVSTFVKCMYSANILEVEAGTNGRHGGDAGHGCRTYIRIADKCGSNMEFNVYEEDGEEGPEKGIEIFLGGDCELYTIIEGLKFITRTLEFQDNPSFKENSDWRIKST